MLQSILTGLAGLALGIVIMRLWKGGAGEAPQPQAEDAAAPAPQADQLGADGAKRSRNLLIGAGAMVALAVAVLLLRSPDDGAAAPQGAAAPASANGAPPLGDVDSAITGLAARLEKTPNDGEGFRMLGWSYMMTGHPDKAIDPYKRAIKLLPNSALVHSGYGEALVGLADGKVTPEAKSAFDRAVALDKADPRGRYFEALWLAQNGKTKEALDQWIALAQAGPADAPWQEELRTRIKDTASKLGVDVSGKLGPAVAAAAPAMPGPSAQQMAAVSQLPPAQQQASIEQMVGGLAGKLKANPNNPDGWGMLLRSRMVMKQADQAGRDLVTARKALANDPAALAKVNAAARDAGVPGA